MGTHDPRRAARRATPADQAQGLRRLFAGRAQRLLPLVANPHVPGAGAVLDHVAGALVQAGWRVLVVDAAENSPAPHELARLDLAAAIETLSPGLRYLAARGLPRENVDARGSAAAWLDALADAAPDAEVLLLHADAGDLARLLGRRAARPVLVGADDVESTKHAYAAAKLLAQRCGLMTFDLLLAAAAGAPRAAAIATTLGDCADRFLGALLRGWARVDPAAVPGAPGNTALERLLAGQLTLDDGPAEPPPPQPPGVGFAPGLLRPQDAF